MRPGEVWCREARYGQVRFGGIRRCKVWIKMKRQKNNKDVVEDTVPNNGNSSGDDKKFRIVELDILRGNPGSTFKTIVEAKDVQSAIETFYKRFPDSARHIMVVPDEHYIEHTGYVAPKVIIKVQKKKPLIKLVSRCGYLWRGHARSYDVR